MGCVCSWFDSVKAENARKRFSVLNSGNQYVNNAGDIPRHLIKQNSSYNTTHQPQFGRLEEFRVYKPNYTYDRRAGQWYQSGGYYVTRYR